MLRSKAKLKRPIGLMLTSVLLVVSSLVEPVGVFGQAKHRITEITFTEESSWQGLMGKYVLSKDHTATMAVPDWKSDTPRMLVFRGDYHDFDLLARTMESQGFFKLRGKYSADVFDANLVTVTAVRNRIRRTVVDYGNVGPVNFWALKQLIRGEMRKIKWKAVEETTGSEPKKVIQ